MKSLKVLFAAVLSIIAIQTNNAQDNWSVELRPGINFATGDLADAELKTGFGAELAVSYNFMEHLGAYVGWGWNKFTSDSPSFAGSGDTDFEETGYTFGLQFIHPINNSSTSYLIRAGGIYNHIEAENSMGDITADSGHGLGWEIGAGIQAELGSNWNLRPQLGYRALSRDIEIGSATTDVDLNYFSIGVGIAKVF
jgi:opacity protein-like surface antigen